MTNGEKIKEVFPSIELYEKSHDAIQINFDSVWWNTEYKDPTTENDLGVDREDAVERLNALKQLIGYDKDSEIVKATQKSLDMAIKALEQEPILDKIRAEIKKLQKMCDKNDLNLMAQYSAFGMVLDILDKYKAETEEI